VSATAATVPVGAVSSRRAMYTGIFFLLLAAGLFALGLGMPSGESSVFGLDLGGSNAVHVPNLTLSSRLTVFVIAAICAGLGAWQLARGFGRRTNAMLGVVVALLVLGFLTWAASGRNFNLTGMLSSTLLLAAPITYGALCGVLCERAAVINIGIEGMLLSGAFVGAVVGSLAGNLWIGTIAAALVGALLAAALAVLAIRYRVDQIIAGTFINLFALGMTGFLTKQFLEVHPEWNDPGRFQNIAIPGLSKIPVLGPVLFDQNVLVYVMFIILVIVQIALFRTRWGLRVRAVGEHPQAADTVGIRVLYTRYRNVILAGLVAGTGGAFFTLAAVGSFDENMTAGRGFIALAAMIFGRWNPVGAFMAALVFGFADALQTKLSILAVPIPSEFLVMAPYLVTIAVVAGVVRKARPPAADGKPYIKN